MPIFNKEFVVNAPVSYIVILIETCPSHVVQLAVKITT